MKSGNLLAIIVFFLGIPVLADSLADLDALIAESNKSKSEGNYADAEYHLKQAIQLSVDRTGSMSTVSGRVARILGDFYIARGQYGDAENYLQRALIISSGYRGAVATADGAFRQTRYFLNDALANPSQLPGNLEVANTLSSLANLYTKQGKYTEAERLLRRVIQIYETGSSNAGDLLNYTPNAVQLLAEHQRSLAQVLYKGGNPVAAETQFKTYVETVRKAKGPSPELAEALDHLAAFYKSQNRSSDADSAENEAKDMRPR